MFSASRWLLGVAICLLGCVHVCSATEISGPYVGVAAGGSGASFDAAGSVFTSSVGGNVTQQRDRSDQGARFFAGFALNNYLALEVAAGVLGQYEVVDRAGGQSLRNELSVGAVAFDVIGRWPISERFALYLGAGPAYVRTNAEATTLGGAQLAPGTKPKRSDTRVVPHLRLGATWLASSRWEFRLETDAYFDIGEARGANATGRANANSLAVAVAYHF
jgi:opacity protein-like surface antigen